MTFVHLQSWRQESVVGIATRLGAGQSVVPNPVRAIGFSVLQNVKAVSEVHPDSQVMGTRVISRCIILITYISIAQRIKISRAVPLLPLYAFMV
jgi:hypothetical protein